MTLQEIFDILTANIQANGGSLKLAPGTISSPEITGIFDAYLLNQDLVIDEAVPVLNETSVTVSGEGNSLLFFQTNINTLTFTIPVDEPSMAVNADAIISDEDGWTFGSSFPVLKYTNWGGYYDPADAAKWIQYLFFDSANLSLTSDGLKFSGLLKLTGMIEPLTFLFNGMNSVEVKGSITLNKGSDGFVADSNTVVPVMKLIGKIGVVEISLGSLPTLTLQFSMNASAYIVPKGKNKGKPVPVLKLLVEATIPIETITGEVEAIGVAAVVGVQSNVLTLRAVLPETIEVGIAEIISLANNENVLAIMPANMPVLNDFVLKDWSVTFNTKAKSISTISFDAGTRAAFNWVIIPGYITLTSVELWITIAYLNGTFSAGLTVGGSIQLGTGDDAAVFNITAAFPGFVFMGALDDEKPLDLKPILTYLLGPQIGGSLPDTLKLSTLNISIDPKNSSYSLSMAITTDLEIPVPISPIIITEVAFDINYVAGAGTGSVNGNFKLGKGEDVLLFVSAAYGGEEEGWVFSGGLQDGTQIKLGDLIKDYLPAEFQGFNPVDITIDNLLVTITQGVKKSYYFKLGATWKLELGLSAPLFIKALTEITYDPAAKPIYDGYVEGELILGNISLKARVDFKDEYNVYTFTFMNKFRAILTKVDGDSMICFDFTDNTSLGDIIAMLVSAATGQEITLPSPWNVMNNIKLKDFVFSFNITKNKIGLSYSPSINLGFINIEQVTLYYTYFPDDQNKNGVVEIAITQGSFLGGALPLPKPWDATKPEDAPAVPGAGESLFKLEFLGMGQHVSVKNGKLPDSVSAAVDLLKKSFESSTPDPNNPIEGTGLEFNSSSNWLIGTQFKIVDTFAIGIVFFDPDLYGLSLYVDGPRARVFQGLKFEILYKKVSDTVGVYQVYLKLPDAIRQIDFGTVSVTLPSLKIYIYTNGDFKIDFGFPVNDNYSESFGLQLLPFVGSGGFYFGVLSAETAETVPVASNGNFSPVIVFGVGLRVGIGKEINKGILKAGISIVVQGILEGTFAQFNYYEDKPTNVSNPTYFYILGKIAIVGHVYGSVDFLIISAEVDLKVFVAARIVFESYEPILISLSAGVSVSVKVRINLGLFSISIGMSFSTTIEESFTIGSKQPTPWIENSQYAVYFREPSLRALDDDNPCPIIPAMNWQPVIPPTPILLDILYIPQFTAATEDADGQKAKAVAMLYLESSIDQPSFKKSVLRKGVVEEEEFAFTKFAKGAFLWVLGAYFNKTDEGIPVDTILDETITIAALNEIVCYFSQDGLVEPFTLDDVFRFMANYLKATVTIPPRVTDLEVETTVSVLPILPNLIFDTPGGEIYFDNEKAQYKYDQEQLKLIHIYFKDLAVRNQGDAGAEEKPLAGFSAEEEQSLATFMLIDYISLLAKEACQKGIDRLTALGLPVGEGDSVEDIVSKYPHFGISAVELAYSNRKRSLRGGATLSMSRLNYTVKHNDTLESVCARFNVGHSEFLRANTYLKQQATNPCAPKSSLRQVEMISGLGENNSLIPGATIVIPGIKHITSSANGQADDLLSVAKRYGVNVLDLIAENTSVPGLFPAGKKIVVPFVDGMTVRELIAAMEENGDFEQLSGLSANIMLQGLRVPLPKEGSAIGEPEAMYKVSGQQIDASTLAEGQSLTLKLTEALPWLGLGVENGTELPYTLLEADILALDALQGAPLEPVIIDLVANPLFEIQPRKFTLPSNITWQVPAALTLANGTNELQDTIDPSIWMFQTSLQALLNGYDAIAPKVALLKQVQETKTKTSKPEPIVDYSWSTKIDVRLTQVRSSEDPTKLMPNVYELQGIDQAAMTLLKNLVGYYGDNPGSGIIRQIDVLYSKEPAKEGQTAPPSGLKSDSIANTSMYLLQTNLSTLSNPSQFGATARLTETPGMQENLLGMNQIEFLKYAWEAAIVGTGGYYFYYLVKDSKAGLPEYLFNGDTDNIITLVITYNITDNVLLNFLNSAVIRDPINIDNEILYVETLAQTVSNVTPEAGETLHSFAKRYGTTVTKIALQNRKAVFRSNASLSIPPKSKNANNGAYLAGASETLESVAEKHNVSIIALAHANKNIAGLFTEPLTFDTRIEVKVATVPPGNIGFSMSRKNPLKIPDLDDAEINLQQLYNLLGYNVAGNEEFDASAPGLPVAPGDKTYEPPTDLDMVVRPSAEEEKDYLYDRIVPIYPFVKTDPQEPAEGDVPPEKENPYRAVGKTAEIDLRWQDIFGNLTSFTNTGGPATLPAQTIGYIDPVVGISLYPSVSASYIVEKPVEGTPTLQITLAFNPTPYVPVKPDDESWRERASSDREAYKQIYYQLLQTDMKVSITNSLEGADSIKAIEGTAKETLMNLVVATYQYLGELVATITSPYVFYLVETEGETLQQVATEYGTTPENIRRINPSIPADGILKKGETIIILPIEIPADQVIETPVSDKNKNSLFALTTSLTLSREFNLVDDNFKDEPSVIFSTSVLGPNLKRNASSDNSNSITIQEFAQKLEAAFPELKAASGTPQIGVEDDSSIEIWVARFNDSATGIQFSILNAGNPFYFALLPLANHLLSRDRVKIYPYVTGTPISDMNAVEASFNGVDIEKLAQTCLAAIDTFLQADFAIPAWQVEQAMAKDGVGDDEILYPYQYIIKAKKTLADNIVEHIATVLEDGNTPDDGNTRNAAERLRQELLISLSNAYSIDTILQFNVEVTSQYTDTDVIAPNLFGKVIDPNDTTQNDQKAYAFSTTRFSLEKSDIDAGEQSYLTVLFNSKKENDLQLESGYFPIELQYEINSIEHEIEKVTNIDDYQSSSWLTFILPFDGEDTELGNLKIPIPLRAYPTSPSLTAQTFKSADIDKISDITEDDKLQEAKKWDYEYTYDYLRAQQDTINTDIILNVPSSSLQARLFADEEDPDLFAALLQFSSAYPGIQRDFSLYLLDQSNQEFAYTAMQSFAWLVKRVADAWGKWQEDRGLYSNALVAQANYKYQIVEGEKIIEGQNVLLITVTPQPGTDFTLPEVEIAGFKMDTVEAKPKIKSYAYYNDVNGGRQYLSPEEGRAITQRNIWYRDFNIINQENVWSGISVIRNKILVPGIATNRDFIYTTPAIRFVSVLTPLLDPDITINIAGYTKATGKQKLDVYLSNFLKELFIELADETTSRQIKVGINYSYNIQEGVESLRAVIPISITTPYDLPIPGGWQTDACPLNPYDITPENAFVCQLSALIQKWFAGNNPVTTNAQFDLDVSLFAGLSNTQLPVLRLRNLYLNEKDIQWS